LFLNRKRAKENVIAKGFEFVKGKSRGKSQGNSSSESNNKRRKIEEKKLPIRPKS
jgi:hypothetical protein